MSHLVIRPLDGTAPSDRPAGVTEQVVQINGDPPRVIRSFDLRGEDVDIALSYVFGRNVAAARAENERLTGNPDGIPGPTGHPDGLPARTGQPDSLLGHG